MNCQDRVFPSWNRRGGCASKKKARSLRSGADGVVIMVYVDVETLSRTDHPVCAFIRRLRSIFLMAQPPLLSEEGNTLSWQFIHTFYDRRYSLSNFQKLFCLNIMMTSCSTSGASFSQFWLASCFSGSSHSRRHPFLRSRRNTRRSLRSV